MCNAGQNQFLNILQQRVKRLALRWRICWKRCANLPRLRLREHRKRIDAGLIIRDPVHHGMAMAAKFVGSHVERLFFRHALTSEDETKLIVSEDVGFPCDLTVVSGRAPLNSQAKSLPQSSRRSVKKDFQNTTASCKQTRLCFELSERRTCDATPSAWARVADAPAPAHMTRTEAVPPTRHNRTPDASQTLVP